MFYDREQDCWAVIFDGQPYGLQCGEGFDLILGYYTITLTAL
ncbi:DUF5348 domain-containing protein [Sporolactobacillus vineae]|nr:DUF5348 domain-containing protein [Sporolactobacillus vineae]